MKALVVPFLLVLILTLAVLPVARPDPAPPWAADALAREADYIVNCSFTELTTNGGTVRTSADAYGALNVDRIYQRGPDWVRPGESAMGAIGLMAAAIQLKALGSDISRYDQVLSRFFPTWVLAKAAPILTDSADPDDGGFVERVYYGQSGNRIRNDPANAGVTGQMIAAMWKYYEYNLAVGRPQAANDWLQQAWPLARAGGDFIRRNYNATYRLVKSNAGSSDLWVTDSTYAVMAFRCLDRWAVTAEMERSFDYSALAAQIAAGLQGMKDDSTRKGFFRYRTNGSPTYGDRVDQIGFLPYEADVLDPGDPFCKAISDWWTNGSGGIKMTVTRDDPNDWRNFGTHHAYIFAGGLENNRLYPGPGLQLAKMEWKYARRTGDTTTAERAWKRFQWAFSTSYSNLWLGAAGTTEANVGNGLMDWRDATNYSTKAGDWERFVDTSAYFIEALLMLEYGVDTKYVPN